MAKKKNDAVNPDFADMENPTFFDSVEDMNESGLIDDGVIYSDNGDELLEENTAVDAEPEKNNADELVELVIPFDHTTGATNVKFSINLNEFVIAVGEPVMVPKYVRDYWVSMSRQKFEFDMQRRAFESNDE